MGEALDPNIFGEDQRCFGCGPNNPIGLQLHFERSEDEVWTRFTPPDGYEGPPGIFHGGLQAMLIDEVAAWTVVGLRDLMGLTFSLQVRLSRPVRTNREIVARGRIVSESDKSVTIAATLEQDGAKCVTGKVVMSLLDAERAERALGQPLPEAWRRFCKKPDPAP